MRHSQFYGIAMIAVTLLMSNGAAAEPPPLLPIQGYLTDSSGAPLDGDTSVRFRLYDAETAGTVLHDETQTVAITSGQFTAYLGTVATLDLSIFAANADVFLGIKVETDDEATPRLRLATAPFAATATYCGDAETLGGLAATDFAASDHTHPAENAATLCNAGEYLDGDGTCQTVSSISDTNAGTLCSAGQYLDGDGSCQSVPVDTTAATQCTGTQYLAGDGSCLTPDTDTDTSATTECTGAQYLAGDGSCLTPDTDTDTNTNADTICADGEYLRGDGNCYDVGPHRYNGRLPAGESAVVGTGSFERGVPVRIVFGDALQQVNYTYFVGMANDGNSAIKGFVFETGQSAVDSLRLSTGDTSVQYTASHGFGELSGSGTTGSIQITNNHATDDLFYTALFGPSHDAPW